MSVYTWGLLVTEGKAKVEALPAKVASLKDVTAIACGEVASAAVTASGRLYTWGSGRGGRLGHGNDATHAKPRPVDGLRGKTVLSVAIGESHMVCVTADGRLGWQWGKLLRRSVLVPEPIPSPTGDGQLAGVVSMRAGYAYSMAAVEDGAVYTWGKPGAFGVLGRRRAADTPTPTPVDVPPSHFVSAGSLVAAAITTEGQLYMWGCGLSGALGQGDRVNHPTPVLVDGFGGVPVTHVACTAGQIASPVGQPPGGEAPHTLAVTADGSAWSWGTCHKGMLANHTHKILSPPDGDELTPYRIGSPTQDEPKAGPSGYLAGETCVAATSAAIHSTVLTASGRLFSFGCGSDGRTGTMKYLTGLAGHTSRMKCYISAPTEIHLPAGRVRAVDSARRHMVAIVDEGAAAAGAGGEA